MVLSTPYYLPPVSSSIPHRVIPMGRIASRYPKGFDIVSQALLSTDCKVTVNLVGRFPNTDGILNIVGGDGLNETVGSSASSSPVTNHGLPISATFCFLIV